MNQIHLLVGENSFELRERKLYWIHQFVQKHGEENLLRLDAKKISFQNLLNEISTMPFIAAKRLVVLEGIPNFSKEEITLLSSQMHPDVILLIVEPKPDKRLSASKALFALAEVEEFPLHSPQKLHMWFDKSMKCLNMSCTADARNLLLDLLGDNQDMLYQEMTKLSLYAKDRTVEIEDVQQMVLCMNEKKIWELMDLIGNRQSYASLMYVERLLQQGESCQGIWNILLWMLSSLVPVFSVYTDGVTNPASIAKQTGISFGSARGLLPIVQTLDYAQVQSIIQRVIRYDTSLKTGGFRSSVDQTQELKAIVDRTILACCAG